MPTLVLAIVTLIAVWTTPISAQAGQGEDVYPAGIYSNVRYYDDTGDVAGMEVHILPTADDDYYALVQFSSGAPLEPFLVKAYVRGTHVEFDILTNGRKVDRFIGDVSRKGLKGRFESGEEDIVTGKKTFFLSRGKIRWL